MQTPEPGKKLQFVEPHPTGGHATVTLTKEQAVNWTRAVHPELSDEQALENFIVVHWAWYVESEDDNGK